MRLLPNVVKCNKTTIVYHAPSHHHHATTSTAATQMKAIHYSVFRFPTGPNVGLQRVQLTFTTEPYHRSPPSKTRRPTTAMITTTPNLDFPWLLLLLAHSSVSVSVAGTFGPRPSISSPFSSFSLCSSQTAQVKM